MHAQHRQGCEARITGDPERAIITVNSRRLRRRRRSSIGHELGHWQHHRGRILVCRANDIGRGRRNASPAERTADSYAADLLLPAYLFKPVARAYPKLDFATVQVIADIFDASYTATAIRLVETGHAYALLVCHGREGRKWFTSTPGVPDRWFPRKDLDNESSAPDVLSGRAGDDAGLRKIGADAWFDRIEAARYEALEQTISVGTDEILSLIVIGDEEMLEDTESFSARRR